MNESFKQELDMTLYLMLEGCASEPQVKKLNTWLEKDPEVFKYSMDFYLVASALRKSKVIPSASLNTMQEIEEQCALLKVFADAKKARDDYVDGIK